jgi:alpha-amylase
MKTIRTRAYIVLIAALATATLPAMRAEANDFNNTSELATYYLQQRALIAPIIPPLLPSSLETLEAMILKGDYSFQELDGWYFPWADGPHTAGGSLAAYNGQSLVIYEDLATASIKILTAEGKTLATFNAEAFPDLSALKGDAYERALLAELNRRSVTLWISFVQPDETVDSSLAASSFGGGYAMMSMGGSNELEAIEFALTNDGMVVTFAWPADFTNRLEIYSCDSSNYNGLGSWRLVEGGFITTGTNQLRWLDLGQLGRGSPLDAGIRFYTAGKGGEVDSDSDGYGDSYEHLVLGTEVNDPDTDNDGVSDGPFDPDNNGSIVAGPDAFPFDSGEWLDTDGDGIGDNADSDDDGDGLADGSDPDALNPRVIARFKAVGVDAPVSGFTSGYSSMSVAGNFQGWDPAANNMRLVANYTWEYTAHVNHATPAFKFAANGNWTVSWGESGQSDYLMPIGGTADGAADIVISNSLNGLYKFTFHETTLVYSVESATTTDTGNETFDVSSSGRMLPYAPGGDARGFGRIHGGIYFNNDGTNLYIGIAGFEKGDDNTLLLFLDADGTTSGVSSLASVSSGPSAFSVANNLAFNSTNFVPEVGILVGNRFADARNYPALGAGQGVYSLSGTAANNFPGFDLKTGAISQWGDRGTNSANAGIEIALSLSSLGLSQGGTFKAAAIIAGGPSGNNRWFSGESYGESVSGTLVGNDFQDGSVTLIGSVVYVSDQPAPAYGGPPPFDGDDVMLQGYQWNVPTNTTLKGIWYDRLRGQADSNEFSRFTMMWMPPPQKCANASASSGYDPFDYYDLGTYNEKFSVETRYGSEAELQACMSALRAKGINPIVDLVFNHNVGGYSSEGGTGTLNFAFGNHDTFEKIDPNGSNGNNLYNNNVKNEPFQLETIFGPDVNVSHHYQRQGLKNWGSWVTAKAAYGGYRWDYTQGIEPWFMSEFMDYAQMKGRFSVMEYWEADTDATVQENQAWLALTDYRSALFDMRLHELLEDMCNESGSTFNMGWLNGAGLVGVNALYAVTFPESHDTIRPYEEDGKRGITQHKMLAYAYVLMSEGLPMIAYNDYFLGPYTDPNPPNDPVNDGWTGTPLKAQIDPLIDARRKYAGGSRSYLSQSNTADLFIMKRDGDANKPGCILVLNDHMSSTLSDSVYTGWASTNLVDVLNTNHVVSTDASGIGTLSASNRSYRVYVRQGDL